MYEEFYQLTKKPFALNPDPAFYYGSKEHSRVLAYLRYGINQGEGFIVVSGDVGAGKTTLIGALLEELGKNEDIIAAQLVTTQLLPDDLLRMVASSFGLRYEKMTKSELLKEIESFLYKQSEKGKRVLLIVDEAQNLERHSLEELRMLSNFQNGTHSLLQSFLLGQGEFRDTLRQQNLEQFRQRIIASYHLGPMVKSEIKNYIEHRMKKAGWKSDPHFANEVFAEIYRYTDGIPRRINTLCDRVLLHAFTEESHDITLDTMEAVVSELDEELHFSRDDADNSLSGKGMQSSTVVSGEVGELISSLEKRVSNLEDVILKGQAFLKALIDK